MSNGNTQERVIAIHKQRNYNIQNDLDDVIQMQQVQVTHDESFPREALQTIPTHQSPIATIITGVRRCGKSTFAEQLMARYQDDSLLLNFDVPRLYGFQMDDFRRLDTIIAERGCRHLFFDEIQVVQGWELYINQKLQEGFQVVITGSNASLLSRELGTHLTGRHVDSVLYPFSYTEYCGIRDVDTSAETFNDYLNTGGFPAYIRWQDERLLNELANDILYRDILVRYNIRDEKPIKNLLLFVMANIGNRISATRLVDVIGVKTTNTVVDYLTYLENTYLLQLVPKFSYSYRAQLISPKKMYCIDTGLHNALSPSSSQDRGHKLENAVYLALRRQGYEVFYFEEERKECDFVLCRHNHPEAVVQVCLELNSDNEARELGGLTQAMDYFNLTQGLILTENQEDEIHQDKRTIYITPVWKWLTKE